MATVTGSEVFEVLKLDPRVQEGGEVQLELMRPFVEATPNILADYLLQPVSLETLMVAKMTFLRYCLANGIIERAGQLLPEDAFGFLSRENGLEMMKDAFEELIETLAQIVTDVPGFMKQRGVSDQEVILSDEVGLSPELAQQYMAGTLNIEDILRAQPGVILINNQ